MSRATFNSHNWELLSVKTLCCIRKAFKQCSGGLCPVGWLTVYSLAHLASIEMKLDAVICLVKKKKKKSLLIKCLHVSTPVPWFIFKKINKEYRLEDTFIAMMQWLTLLNSCDLVKKLTWAGTCKRCAAHSVRTNRAFAHCFQGAAVKAMTLSRTQTKPVVAHAHSKQTWICKMEHCKDEDSEVVTSLLSPPRPLPRPFSILCAGATQPN